LLHGLARQLGNACADVPGRFERLRLAPKAPVQRRDVEGIEAGEEENVSFEDHRSARSTARLQ
jgi:hypothetical protein